MQYLEIRFFCEFDLSFFSVDLGTYRGEYFVLFLVIFSLFSNTFSSASAFVLRMTASSHWLTISSIATPRWSIYIH